MMNAYRQVVLGTRALEYIRDCLRGGKTLSRYLLEHVQLENGRVFTGLPPGVPEERLTQFELGILPEPPSGAHLSVTATDGSQVRLVPIPNINPWLIELIARFLRDEPWGVCLFENALASASDPWLASLTTRVTTYEEEVYHVLLGGDAGEGRIAETLGAAKTHPVLIGVLARVSDARGALARPEIGADLLRRVAERPEYILVGAYDGEGYLVWSKSTT